MRFRDRFPAWFLVDEMADISRKLSDKREPAMYGDELSTTLADLLFSRPEAEEALRYAELAHEAVKNYLQNTVLNHPKPPPLVPSDTF